MGGYGGYVVYQQQGQFGAGFEESLHTVERVVDGDTFVVENKTTVRLIRIDAPELDQCFGLEAKQELQRLVLGRKVRLQKDSTATDADGRLLRYVFIYSDHPKEDNVFVNNVLLMGGFAKISPGPRDKLFEDVLMNTAGVARNNGKGLYTKCGQADNVVAQPSKDCTIKGNNSTDGHGKVYFFPSCQNYVNVKLEKDKGDMWFCSEKEAIVAGYKKASGCPEFTD
jgi:micrococcal nuclease